MGRVTRPEAKILLRELLQQFLGEMGVVELGKCNGEGKGMQF